MRRETRGFLIGAGLILLWVISSGAMDPPRGRFEFHTTDVNYYVLDTETGEMYLFSGGGKSGKIPKWYYVGGPGSAENRPGS